MQVIYKFIQKVTQNISPVMMQTLHIGDSFYNVLEKLQGVLYERTLQKSITSTIVSGSNTTSDVTVQSFTIPANSMQVGSVITLHADGTVNKPYTITNNNYNFKIGVSNSVKISENTGLGVNSVGDKYFDIDVYVTVRKIGSSGEIVISYVMQMPSSNSAYSTKYGSGVSVTVDTTNDFTLDFIISFANSSGSNNVTTKQFFAKKE